MGIRDKRLNKAINRILREELQRGNLPSSKEFMWRLSSYLNEHNLSRPEYNFRSVRRGMKALSPEYNRTIDTVYADLETLYESAIELHNDIGKNLSRFDVDKSKVEYEINVLENKLREMILMYAKSGFLSSVFDVFDDMDKVDVTQSSVYVDVKNKEVTIPDIKNTSTRIVPDADVHFYLLEEIARMVDVTTISGRPANALTDNMNETWQQLITSDKQRSIAGYYHVDFEEKQIMNRISLSLHGVKPTHIRIEFTPDNLNWFTLPYFEEGKTVLDEYTFDFPSITMEQMRILMRKNEPDNESMSNGRETENSFLIGIKELKMFKLDFAEEGVLYSIPLEVEVPTNQNFSVNKVSLLTEEFLPNGTDIEYSIALPVSQGAEPEWKKISPVNRRNPKHEQIIDFKNITRAPAVQFSIDPSLSIGEYEMINLYSNGINFYRVGSVPASRKIIAGTERLFVGKNSWQIKSFNGRYADNDTHIPSLEDWTKPLGNIHYDYARIEDGRPGSIMANKRHTGSVSYMCTLGVFSEKKEEVASSIPASTDPIAIYMNGEKIFEGMSSASTRVNYLFKNGWNEIVVLVYVNNPRTNGSSVNLGFDPRQYGANIYAQARPMEKVSLSDLRFNIKGNDRNKYAITEVNEEQVIVLNHIVPGLEYDFYFHQVEGDVKESILFKAEFRRDRNITNISPKLHKYYLRFS